MPPEPNAPNPPPVPQQPPASEPSPGLSLDPESLKRFADDEVSKIEAKSIEETQAFEVADPAAEEFALSAERHKHLNRRWQLLNKSLSEDIEARRRYAKAIFILIVCWLVAILAILIMHGFLSKREIAINLPLCRSIFKTAIHFELSDNVLLALIGGTTATVIGLFAIVANYFFPKKPN